MRITAGYLSKNGSWLNIDQHHSLMKPLIPTSSFDTNNKELLKSQEFQNYVSNDFWALKVLISKQEDILEINEEILKLIREGMKDE